MSKIDQEDLEAFLIEAELINQKVKALAENKMSAQEFDLLQKKRAQDMRRKQQFKNKKQKQLYEMKVKGRDGKGISKDFSNFCRFCRKQYELVTVTCLKCGRATMSLEERQKQLQVMVEEYKFNKKTRQEKRHKWNMFQKTKQVLWKKSSIDYNKKWDYFVEDSQQEPQKQPILPTHDPNFKALQIDLQERKKKRASDNEKAKKLKEQGNKALKEGDYETARDKYTLALQFSKDIKSVFTNRALVYLKMKKYKKAIEDCTNVIQYMQVFEKVGENKDLMFKAYCRRALARKERKQYKEALSDVEYSLKLFGEDKSAILLKKQLEGLVTHMETVNKLYRQNVTNDEEQTEIMEQNMDNAEKEVVRQIAQSELQEQRKKQQIKQKQKTEVCKNVNPIKDIPKRLQNLSPENIQILLTMLSKNKEFISIFLASNGIEICLQEMINKENKQVALLIYLCLQGDGVAEKRVLQWGYIKILQKLKSLFTDETKLNQSVYDYLDNVMHVMVGLALCQVSRVILNGCEKTFDFVEFMFSRLITKYKKQTLLLYNFILFVSNICYGQSILKMSYLKKQKLRVILEAVYSIVLDQRHIKNRMVLELKQAIYSLLSNIVTSHNHRVTYLEFMVSTGRMPSLKQEIQFYPRSSHNFQSYMQNVLSLVANMSLDTHMSFAYLGEAIFQRFISKWKEFNKTIIYRSLLSVSRFKYEDALFLSRKIKIFQQLLGQTNPLANLEDKFITLIVKILNVLYELPLSEDVLLTSKLLTSLTKFVKENKTSEVLFCNTCNLFGVMALKKGKSANMIQPYIKQSIEVLVQIAKDRVGNWRKSAAILLGKSCNIDQQCRKQLDKYHGMDVLKSIASFVMDKK